MLAVVALVALRLALGCHFLYEGVWKIKHRDEFSAEPFLTQAKGPISGLFYAMVPDINGRERLQIVTDAKGKTSIDAAGISQRWNGIRKDFLNYYHPARSADDAAQAAYERLARAAERTYNDFREKAETISRRTPTISWPISGRSIGSKTTRSDTSKPRFRSNAAGTG